ncbi:MAG: hypothetical protein IIY96_08070 [Lachnospiraceae bacterium]|nr:hypothetical protein [Lachnospiraceae bacterium]
MVTIFNFIMTVLQAVLAIGSLGLAFLEKGALPKILYFLAALLLAPILPIRRKAEERLHLKPFIIPAAGLVILIAAVMITPIH